MAIFQSMRKWLSRVNLTALFFLLFISTILGAQVPSSNHLGREMVQLTAGDLLKGSVAAQQVAYYRFTASHQGYALVEVEPESADLSVTIKSAEGSYVTSADVSHKSLQPGRVSWANNTSGEYLVSIESKSLERPTRFSVRFRIFQKPEDSAKALAALDVLFMKAESLRLDCSLQKTEEAITKYNQVIQAVIYSAMPELQAYAQRSIGLSYDQLTRPGAQGYFQQSLRLFQILSDKHQEGLTLSLMMTGASQSLAIGKELKDPSIQARALNSIAWGEYFVADYTAALTNLNLSLASSKSAGNKLLRVDALSLMGIILNIQGDSLRARSLLAEALQISISEGDVCRQSDVLLNQAYTFEGTGDWRRALELSSQALEHANKSGAILTQFLATESISDELFRIGDMQSSRAFYDQAVLLQQQLKIPNFEGSLLNSKGVQENNEGHEQQAIEDFSKALGIFQNTRNRRMEAVVLANVGLSYFHLASYREAFQYVNRALKIQEDTKDRQQRPLSLEEVGRFNEALGDYPGAIRQYQIALDALNHGDQIRKAEILARLGDTYRFLGDHPNAHSCYAQSITLLNLSGSTIYKELPFLGLGELALSENRPDLALKNFSNARIAAKTEDYAEGEAVSLDGIGRAYEKLHKTQESDSAMERSLEMEREAGSLAAESETLSHLMSIWRDRKSIELAIIYGKEAVETVETMRRTLTEFDKEVQTQFLKSKGDTYRNLAEMLIGQKRLTEAEQVIKLLKEYEYHEFVSSYTREGSGSPTTPVDKTAEEKNWTERYKQIADNIGNIGKRHGELYAKTNRSATENVELTNLDKDLQASEFAFHQFLRELSVQLQQKHQVSDKFQEIQNSDALMQDLRVLGPGVVAIYTLITREALHVILVTPDFQLAHSTNISESDLNQKITDFQKALGDEHSNPLPLAKELYAIILGGPIRKQLDLLDAKTLVWSLDGKLRYIPMAALHDDNQYIAEKYKNVVVALASNSRISSPSAMEWTGLGLGVSKRHGNFPALNAPEELKAIIREGDSGSSDTGVFPGKILLDENFTEQAFRNELRDGFKTKESTRPYSMIHVASHFQFSPGDHYESYLLLGDGQYLRLPEIETSANLFGGIELLTLAACNTMTGDADAHRNGEDGSEVEGFGALAQHLGAKAVLASLWSVNDCSTESMMDSFYQIRVAKGISKAEALQEAQMLMLKGELKGKVGTCGFRIPHSYAHPFFWAPFVLLGNWR